MVKTLCIKRPLKKIIPNGIFFLRNCRNPADSRDDSFANLLTIYAFGPCVYFSSWHEERSLLTTSAHDGQKTEKIHFLWVSQLEGLLI